MEPACGFCRGFVPSEQNAEEILLTHLRNCADCQAETYLMLPSAMALA